ncbi:MAG TPA: hypothetical protein VL027_06560 [Spongiibacteraceae bacterium]|nr:hypothetical protein [Spongiibacteraceae bacterium]
MKSLGKVLLVLIALLVVAYWLLIDGIIATVIEREGSKALKAKLDVEEVEFHLYPTRIAVRGVQATNPRKPSHNLVEIAELTTDLDLSQILAREVIADEVVVSGLRFDRARASSGAIPGLTPPPAPEEDFRAGIPALNLPDPQTLLDAERARIEAELAGIKSELKTLEDQWQARTDELPGKANLEDYKARWKALKKANLVERLAGIDQLKRDIDKDLKQLDQLDDQLKTDLRQVREKVRYAQELPSRELNRALSSVGLDGGLEGLTQALLGEKLAGQLQQLLDAYRAQQAAGPATPTEPEFLVLVRKVLVDGKLELGATTIPFDGTINNVANDLTHWGLPITFELNGSDAARGVFQAAGSLDHSDPAKPVDQVKLAFSDLQLKDLPLSGGEQVGIALQQALASITGNFNLKGKAIDLSMLGDLQQVDLVAVFAEQTSTTRAIAEVLDTVKAFDFGLNVTGDVSDPRIRLKSSLDQLLKTALGAQLQQQAARLKAEFSDKLQAELGPELAEISALSEQLNGFGGLLDGREEELKSLIKL